MKGLVDLLCDSVNIRARVDTKTFENESSGHKWKYKKHYDDINVCKWHWNDLFCLIFDIYRELDFEDVFNIVDKLYCTDGECLKDKWIEYI